MFDWLRETVTGYMSSRSLVWIIAFSVVTFLTSIAVTIFVLIKLPDTYFKASHGREFWVERHPVLRWGGLVLKNLLGAFLVLLGVVMSLPGVPGQGVLTILLGVMLLDFPGKRRLELKLVSRPKVLRTINRIRQRFDRTPLQLDEA
ncbi:MAG TPA: hypothetical protein VGO96_06845 [Pyrinomonadaceae bacterium]|jgi:hypothetical protein|nr:hypothetical protein [Pyrinomonadaceae bacterium]